MNEWIIKHKNKAVNVQSSDGKFRSLTAVKERATWLPGGTAADTSVSVSVSAGRTEHAQTMAVCDVSGRHALCSSLKVNKTSAQEFRRLLKFP